MTDFEQVYELYFNNITIKNPNGNQTGIKKLLVDGKEVVGNEVELFGDGDLHEIIVEM